MSQLTSSVFTFAPLHPFWVIIISVNSDQTANNFRQSMVKNLTPYGTAKLTSSWGRTTDYFSASKGRFPTKMLRFVLDTACSPCFVSQFRFRKLLLEHCSLPKRGVFPLFIYHRSHRKQPSKRDTHDTITRLTKKKYSPSLESIDKRLK